MTEKLLSIVETCDRVSLSRTTLWKLVKENKFPAPVAIYGSRKGFVESEVAGWIAERIANRNAA